MVGGGLAQSKATWRWAFYVNLLLYVLVAPVIILLLPGQKLSDKRSILARAKDFDWIGSVLLVGGSLALIIAVSFGGTVYGWKSGQIIGSFVTAAVCIALLVLQQHLYVLTTQTTRVFPLQFFANKMVFCLFLMICAPAMAILVSLICFFITFFATGL